ncbi:phosphatase PAP2 family protein [uncultured Draconibacterium sp.]|uniref:phosphatase PAP2 family protein n=1 Tax=uncultured Draconibacterium sp. TaxID=1573823 RepID=UPI0032168D79
MKRLLTENKYFLIPYGLLILLSSILLFIYSKAELHILLNTWNSPFADLFFKIITNLGDGLFYLVLLAILLFVNYRLSVIFALGSIFTNIVVQLFKWFLFADVFRPSKYFELYETYKLHLVDGVRLYSLHSFPSGHTATAFNIFFMLALISKNNVVKCICLCIALLTAYSRVYLSQHFLIDTVVGSLVGILGILTSWLLFYKSKKSWMDKSLLTKRVVRGNN